MSARPGNRRADTDDGRLLWRSPAPKPSYDVVIVGGGGHGLATAYYLARMHGITSVAVVEKDRPITAQRIITAKVLGWGFIPVS